MTTSWLSNSPNSRRHNNFPSLLRGRSVRPLFGLEVNETLFNASTSCPITAPSGSGAKTDATGSSVDRIWLCCQPTWSCGASWDQSFMVNNYPVLVLANGLRGSKNHIQTVCQNGQGTCPDVYPVP